MRSFGVSTVSVVPLHEPMAVFVDQVSVLGQESVRERVELEEPRIEHLLGIGSVGAADELAKEGDFGAHLEAGDRRTGFGSTFTS